LQSILDLRRPELGVPLPLLDAGSSLYSLDATSGLSGHRQIISESEAVKAKQPFRGPRYKRILSIDMDDTHFVLSLAEAREKLKVKK